MSKILYCFDCGDVLHETSFVTDSSGFMQRSKGLLYCMNGNCPKYALLSLYGSTVRPKKRKAPHPKKGKKE